MVLDFHPTLVRHQDRSSHLPIPDGIPLVLIVVTRSPVLLRLVTLLYRFFLLLLNFLLFMQATFLLRVLLSSHTYWQVHHELPASHIRVLESEPRDDEAVVKQYHRMTWEF